ncbi:MAG: 3-hydroxybutyryl-CoA dehydrogenase [candidate division Zixibacteria bacterium]|nr:3-hydroxybutyryl-CoA dehydrogenase [candidate division Zixibacteria bacterium]
MDITEIGICGCGQMGAGIAEVASKAGVKVISYEVEDKVLQKGLAKIDKSLSRAVEKGKLDEAGKKSVLENITGTTDLNDLASCQLVIEAITENFEVKTELYKKLDTILNKDAIIASNTSSLSITEMGATTSRPEKFCGLHFFNPVAVMKLVEVVKTITTSDETFETAKAFGDKVGKVVVSCKDTPGFVVNRLLVPYLLDAIRALEAGVATRDDIDNGMKLGCGHPMGPLELTDFIGLDTIYYIGEIMFDEFKEHHYASPPLLKAMVKAGYMGRKSGRGFYDYSEVTKKHLTFTKKPNKVLETK